MSDIALNRAGDLVPCCPETAAQSQQQTNSRRCSDNISFAQRIRVIIWIWRLVALCSRQRATLKCLKLLDFRAFYCTRSANLESLRACLREQFVQRGDLGARPAPHAVSEDDALFGARERDEEASRRFHLIG